MNKFYLQNDVLTSGLASNTFFAYFSSSSLWKSSSIVPPFLQNLCIWHLEEPKCHCNRLVRDNRVFLLVLTVKLKKWPLFWVFHSGRRPSWGGARAVALSPPSPSLFPSQASLPALGLPLLTSSAQCRTNPVSITTLRVTHTGSYSSLKKKLNFSSLLSSSSEPKLAECQAVIFRQKHRVRFKVCRRFCSQDLNYGLLSHKYHYYVHINLVVIHADNALLIFRGPT